MSDQAPRRVLKTLLSIVCGWFGAILIITTRSSEWFDERPRITLTTGLVVWFLLFVVPVVLLGLSLPRPRQDVLAARVRRIVGLSAVVCVLGIAPQFLTTQIEGIASALALSALFILIVSPGAAVYQAPSVLRAIVWSVWTVPFAALAWSVNYDRPIGDWRFRAVQLSLGITFALVVVALPLVAIATRRRAAALPEARVA